jgi:iron complex transport system ATP-binding protein
MKIQIDNVEFCYNGAPALQNITEHISKGDFIAIVGPNGSGKSTLIKCLNGILLTKKGTVLLNNQNIKSYTANELAKEIAYVPQCENKPNQLTVFDTVLLGRKPYIDWKPSDNDFEIVADILKTLHLEHIAMKNINKLSGGQRQSVFIARALAQEPDVLLLDEPTANLDLRHQLEVMNLLKTLSDEGHTIVMAVHDINLASRYCSKTMMLKDGTIFACGRKEIFTIENIEKLYDIKVTIVYDKDTLFVIPNGLN